MLITDKAVYHSTIKIGLFAGFRWKKQINKVNIETIKSMKIGHMGYTFGSNYIGHEFIMNDMKIGLLRMGPKIFWDRKAIKYLNSLFGYLKEKGVFAS